MFFWAGVFMKSTVLAVVLAVAPGLACAQGGATILDQNRPDRAPPSAAPIGPLDVKPNQTNQTQGPDQAIPAFVLTRVQVEGGTVPAAALKPAWAPFVGKRVGVGELKAMADAVSDAYGRSDVALYTIVTPRQTFGGGVVQLNVIEGYVEDVTLTGEGAGKLVRAYAAKLKHSLPLKRSKLERYLSLMRDAPGVSIDVQLLRGTRPGAVVLAIVAHRKRFEGGVSLNNRGTAYLGQNQVRGDLYIDGVPFLGDQLRLTYATPTDFRRFQYYGGSEQIAVGDDGANMTLAGGYIITRPAFTPIQGRAYTWSVQGSYPVLRGDQKNLYVTGDVDISDSTNAAFGQELFSERVRTVRGAAAYTVQKPVQAYSLSATVSAGLPAFGAQAAINGWSKTNFTKLNMAGKYSHAIGKDWVIRLDAAGQGSGDKLPGSEQFSLGGDEFGRGYPAAIAIGDQGVAGSAELAYRPPKLPKLMEGSEVYAFADGGEVSWRNRPFAGGYTESLASAGGGVRWAVLAKGVVEVEAADGVKAPFPGADDGWRVTLNLKSLMH
jgi:hemolysin activation/secretion protein